MDKKRIITIGAVVLVIGVIVAFLPPVRSRLDWRIKLLQTKIHYALNPPEEAVFVPNTPKPVSTKTPTPTDLPSDTPQPELINTATQTPTPTLTPTALPEFVHITDVPYVHQHGARNYCGPANLCMALNYWGWEGTREDIGEYLKPHELDKNVSIDEMAEYAQKEADLGAIYRYGGTVELLKRLVANGYPVLVEKGVYFVDLIGQESWMGHYNLVIGYDDESSEFITHDSYIEPGDNYRFSYEELAEEWRAFNYIFLVAYDPDDWDHLAEVLGPYADEEEANQLAIEIAEQEIDTLEDDKQRFFAMFNLGTSQVALEQYEEASITYDNTFAFYATLPEEGRPWRMMWYQFGPYEAYFNVERYEDVIDLARQTLHTASDPYLDESKFWQFKAERELEE